MAITASTIYFSGTLSLTLTVIDWGKALRGRGMYDLAYFLTGSMDTEQRRGQEMPLLREGGIRDYDFDECVRDYRLAVLDIVIFYVEVGAIQNLSGETGVLFTETAFPRFFAAVFDLNILEFLQDV